MSRNSREDRFSEIPDDEFERYADAVDEFGVASILARGLRDKYSIYADFEEFAEFLDRSYIRSRKAQRRRRDLDQALEDYAWASNTDPKWKLTEEIREECRMLIGFNEVADSIDYYDARARWTRIARQSRGEGRLPKRSGPIQIADFLQHDQGVS